MQPNLPLIAQSRNVAVASPPSVQPQLQCPHRHLLEKIK